MPPSNRFEDFDKCGTKDIARCFHVTPRTVDNWITGGCPKNDDGTLSIFNVHIWKLGKFEEKKPQSKQDEKLDVEIEYKKAQIDKIRQNMIPREDHEQILSIRAASLRIWLENNAVKNAIPYVGQQLERIQALRLQEVEEMMQAYIGKR